MNNSAFKNICRLSLFEIKISKKTIIGWCIAIFSIVFMYMILFSSMKEMAEIKLQSMPEEMLSFFGMQEFSDMGNYVTYFGMIFNILMIAISIFAATYSANTIYREEKRKTIEFLYSLNVSRGEIYISKLIASFIAVTVVLLSALISSVICGYAVGGESFVLLDCMSIVGITGFTAYFFLAFSIMTAGALSSVNAPVTGSMAVLVFYCVGYLGTLLEEKAEWIKYISPFEMLSPKNALAFENETAVSMCVYLAVAVLFVIIGGVLYKRRDFKI